MGCRQIFKRIEINPDFKIYKVEEQCRKEKKQMKCQKYKCTKKKWKHKPMDSTALQILITNKNLYLIALSSTSKIQPIWEIVVVASLFCGTERSISHVYDKENSIQSPGTASLHNKIIIINDQSRKSYTSLLIVNFWKINISNIVPFKSASACLEVFHRTMKILIIII